MNSETETDTSFSSLQRLYLREARVKLRRLESDLESGGGGVSSRDSSGRFRNLIHHLRGSGSGYGFPAISEAAKALEEEFLSGTGELTKNLKSLAGAVEEGSRQVGVETEAPVQLTTVTLIDDDRTVATLVRHALNVRGYEVNHCASGRVGFEHVRSDPPTVVIVDLGLEDMDGLELIERLRGLSAELPIVVLSGAEQSSLAEGVRRGADYAIQKPFAVNELVNRVKAIVDGDAQAQRA